jgi:hypothetical protein
MKFRGVFGAEEAGIRRYSNDDKPKRAEIAPFERVRITLVTLGSGSFYLRGSAVLFLILKYYIIFDLEIDEFNVNKGDFSKRNMYHGAPPLFL